MRSEHPGILIACEGIDGAGKTTQARLLGAALEGIGADVVASKEPTAGPWGKRLRESASSGRLSPAEELELFIKDRREHVETTIQPALRKGEVVILDRYYFSTAAYQGARGYDPERILAENETFAPEPDLLVILHVPTAVGLQRIGARGDEANLFEREGDLERSGVIFRAMSRPYAIHVDGCLSIEAVHREIKDALYHGALFRKNCFKAHYKNECEPAFCSYRIDGSCRYIGLGQLVPARVG